MTYNKKLAATLFHLFNLACIGIVVAFVLTILPFLLLWIVTWFPATTVTSLSSTYTTSLSLPITFDLEPESYTVTAPGEPTSVAITDPNGDVTLEYTDKMPPWRLWFPTLLLKLSYWVAFLIVLYQLRMLFKTLAAQNPLGEKSIYRLRAIGGTLIAYNVAVVILRVIIRILSPWIVSGIEGLNWTWNYEFPLFVEDYNWLFAGLIVLALAEVFRYSLAVQAERDALHEEQALTV